MPVEERSLTSRGVRKRGKAWLLARAYQSHYVSEIPDRITRASVISSVSRMREIRTSGLMSGGLETQSREPNCRHGAKATERPPDPKASAPAPDSTCAVERRVFLVGCEAHPTIVVSVGSSRGGSWRVRHGLKHSGEKGCVEQPSDRADRNVNER